MHSWHAGHFRQCNKVVPHMCALLSVTDVINCGKFISQGNTVDVINVFNLGRADALIVVIIWFLVQYTATIHLCFTNGMWLNGIAGSFRGGLLSLEPHTDLVYSHKPCGQMIWVTAPHCVHSSIESTWKNCEKCGRKTSPSGCSLGSFLTEPHHHGKVIYALHWIPAFKLLNMCPQVSSSCSWINIKLL